MLFRDSQKGISIVFTFFIMAIVFATVLGLSIILFSEFRVTKNMQDSVVAFYAADSGIEKTLYFDRKKIPVGGSRGLCDICNSCLDCQNCTTSIPAGSSIPEDCGYLTCTNCTVSYYTDFDGKEYKIKATVVPFDGIFENTIKSFGSYKGTTRTIELTYITGLVGAHIYANGDVSQSGGMLSTGVNYYTEISPGIDTYIYVDWAPGDAVFDMEDVNLFGKTALKIKIYVFADVTTGPGSGKYLYVDIAPDGLNYEGYQSINLAFQSPQWYSESFLGHWSDLNNLRVKLEFPDSAGKGVVYTMYAEITY